MLKNTLSGAAVLTVLVAFAFPALADDAALSQTVDALSKQVQQQQKEIQKLAKELKAKKAAPAAQAAGPEAQAKPGVVAPLQPTSLGTLPLSSVVNSNGLGSVSQAPANANPVFNPTVVPGTPTVTTYQQPHLTAPVYHPQGVAATAATAATAPIATPVYTSPAYAPAQVAIASAPAQQLAVPVAATQPATTQKTTANTNNANPGHVGEAPAAQTRPPEVQALANVGGVLTPYGHAVVEPFLQYSRSSVNTFLFQGVEVVSSLLIGSVEANKTSRDLVSTGITARLGVSDRLELEARVPFVWRQDSITNTVQNTNNLTTTQTSNGYGLGDLEVAAHYQINDGQQDWPFFIGNLRYKSDTGSSPFNSEFNADGSTKTLATGSGFNAIEPSITAIYPSDPATLFANLGYIHSIPEDINHDVGTNFVGRVTPGDTYTGSLGLGLALNDRLSLTFGYEHDYVRPTETVVGGVAQLSPSLQVGSALSGISYRVSDRTSINLNLAAGVTRDAPDAVVSLRVPISMQVF